MAISAISSALAGAPKPNLVGYPCACAISGAASAAATSTARVQSIKRMHILHAPVRCNGPALDRIHVIEQRSALERSALGDELLMGGLRVTGLVGRAALNHHWVAV